VPYINEPAPEQAKLDEDDTARYDDATDTNNILLAAVAAPEKSTSAQKTEMSPATSSATSTTSRSTDIPAIQDTTTLPTETYRAISHVLGATKAKTSLSMGIQAYKKTNHLVWYALFALACVLLVALVIIFSRQRKRS
jgi:L-lactate permease